MHEWIEERSLRLREFFNLADDVELLSRQAPIPEVAPEIEEHLQLYNIEWHIIPTEQAVPFDANYIAKMYPMCGRDFARAVGQKNRSEERRVGKECRSRWSPY